MDPNANLREQGECLNALVMLSGESVIDWRKRVRHDARRLSDLRQALYDWIRNGGFDPDWALQPFASKYYGR